MIKDEKDKLKRVRPMPLVRQESVHAKPQQLPTNLAEIATSWTNNISWIRGYEGVLGPMESASALFAEKVLSQNVSPSDPRYRNALYHLLITQTSCFRYWGKGIWTDYGRELCRRSIGILNRDF
jgi:hypothetical protein